MVYYRCDKWSIVSYSCSSYSAFTFLWICPVSVAPFFVITSRPHYPSEPAICFPSLHFLLKWIRITLTFLFLFTHLEFYILFVLSCSCTYLSSSTISINLFIFLSFTSHLSISHLSTSFHSYLSLLIPAFYLFPHYFL